MAEASSSPEKTGPPARKRKSGVIVPHQAKWHQRIGAFLVFISLRALMLTVRCRLRSPSEYLAPNAPGPVIVCFWHNRLASCIKVYESHRKPHASTRGMAALISASRDGAFLAGILELFGVQPVRGSSSRRGPQAMLELTTWAERGYDLAITPDGPRGPRYTVQEGAMALAQITGLPALPVSYHLGWKYQLKSWDRFQIPLPFSRCEIVLGRPLSVPPKMSDAERESLRQQLETEMRAITRD
jgi:lysophospholipid acyltransferase (LPLAT)-like uncharacterized protein